MRLAVLMSLTHPPTNQSKYLWRNCSRAEAPRRTVTERLGDFLEIYGCIDEETARKEACRCLECPDAPCVEGCPLGNQIPRWMALVGQGRFKDAAELLAGAGCMPDVISQLCRETCEDYCVLEKTGAPVAVNEIERFLNHYGQRNNLASLPKHSSNGWRVAVVGSGPCGLACTVELVTAGFGVSVFDTQPDLGGFLAQGVPRFRLDQSFVQRRIQELRDAGVEFQSSCQWGKDLSLEMLRPKYDAVFLGPCVEGTKRLEVLGANLRGVYQALDFIIQMNYPWTKRLEGLDIAGKKVVVLGGGDSAVDALRTALRSGAREALCLYRHEQSLMPADPRQCEEAAVEGARFQFNALPIEVLGSGNQVTAIRCVRTEMGSASAGENPEAKAINGTEFEVQADVVLTAYGFTKSSLLSDPEIYKLGINESGGLAVDEQQMTSVPGVFAAGVLVKSSLGLTEGVRDARQAARGIAAFLERKLALGAQAARKPAPRQS